MKIVEASSSSRSRGGGRGRGGGRRGRGGRSGEHEEPQAPPATRRQDGRSEASSRPDRRRGEERRGGHSSSSTAPTTGAPRRSRQSENEEGDSRGDARPKQKRLPREAPSDEAIEQPARPKQRRDGRFARYKDDLTYSSKPHHQHEAAGDDDEDGAVGAAAASRHRLANRQFRQAKVDSRGRRLVASDEDDEEEEEEDELDDEALDEDGDLEELGDEDDVVDWNDQYGDIEFTDAKRRVAVVNCDWDHIRAVDLFAVFRHSLPPVVGGAIEEVAVYLSDFGAERLEQEKLHGPNLWVRKGEAGYEEAKEEALKRRKMGGGAAAADAAHDDDFGADDDDDLDDDADDDDVLSQEDEDPFDGEGEDGELFSGGKFRQYEIDRMKYYYAVATFDSAETAATVYSQVDGMDIEASGVTLDLRYIDDDETFDESRVKSRASRIPPNYKAAKAFKSAALSQSKFRISWDRDDVYRRNDLRDANTGESEEANLMAYMASDSSDDDMGADDPKTRKKAQRAAIRAKYSSLLSAIGGLPEDAPSGEEDDDDDQEEGEEGRNDGGDEDDDEESDDDDLNRMSDVEMMSDEEDDDGADAGGDMEDTLDLGAGDRAAEIQKQLKRQIEAATDLGTKARLKAQLKRREDKKAKKMALRQAGGAGEEQQDEALSEAGIKDVFGDDAVEREAPRRGRQYQKEMAKAAKAKAAAEREKKKQLNRIRALGGSTAAAAAVAAAPAASSSGKAAAAAGSDEPVNVDRFANRLLNDPRFHIDSSTDKHRKDANVAKLAQAVASKRREENTSRKRPRGE